MLTNKYCNKYIAHCKVLPVINSI